MLNFYLNQTCTLCRKSGTDNRGQPIYDEPIEILCRLQKKYKQVCTKNSELIPVNHVCYTSKYVAVGDSINGETVRHVENWVDLNGKIIGFKVVF